MNQRVNWICKSKAITNVGKVRKINEDNLLDANERNYWVVADGMGGHDSGDVASTKIVEACTDLNHSDGLGELIRRAEKALIRVNRKLIKIASAKEEGSVVGSTFVGLFVEAGWGVCLWVGDSRLYCRRDSRMISLSRDHTDVEDLVDRGEVLREDAEDHPMANVINRAVGGAPDLYVDAQLFELQNNDRFLLCSDGLYKEMREPEISDVLGESETAEEAAEKLVEISLERGCRDNISVIVIDVSSEVAATAEPVS